jgi:hypothetical protein
VHEFGHLVTLNAGQIPESEYYYGWYQNPTVCPQFLDDNGCSRPDSYMNLFYQAFWKDVFEEWLTTVAKVHVNSQEEYRALVEKFYSKHSDLFSRDYAATNIHEDMAESFSHFILEPKPAGNSVVEQKARFYYDFPELVQLRQQMIQGMCSFQP